MVRSDLTVEAFLVLRDAFFGSDGQPKPFTIQAKGNTQDDPLDAYIAQILSGALQDAQCISSHRPLINPDMVLYRPELCQGAERTTLRDDRSYIVAIEVKKLERQPSGQVARSTGIDYNTTPPCGTIRIYDADQLPLDISAFYLFLCQEPATAGQIIITALVLCDGDALNADFKLYLDITGLRQKGIGLGTYGDGINRQRPMMVFSNPLGAKDMDHAASLITRAHLGEAETRLGLAYMIGRSMPTTDVTAEVTAEGSTSGADPEDREFFVYRRAKDIPPGWETVRLLNPFPQPLKRVTATQQRGRFSIPIQLARV